MKYAYEQMKRNESNALKIYVYMMKIQATTKTSKSWGKNSTWTIIIALHDSKKWLGPLSRLNLTQDPPPHLHTSSVIDPMG